MAGHFGVLRARRCDRVHPFSGEAGGAEGLRLPGRSDVGSGGGPAASTSTPPNLYLAAHLATTPDVTKLAAEQLPPTIRPEDPAAITATADPDAGAVTIVATDLDRNSAVLLAQTYGDATIQFLNASAASSREVALGAAQKELKAVVKSLEALGAERPLDPLAPVDPVLQARLDSETARYGAVRQRVEDLSRAESGPAPLQLIGTPEVESLQGGVITAPQDRRARALLAGVLGLVLGLGVALAVDRIDSRLRTRDEAEETFGLPVLGEIPRIRRRKRAHHAIVTETRPDSTAAEAYRSLRSAITLVAQSKRNDGKTALEIPPTHQVLVVTAARGREGKSSTVANLAAALAEIGRTVIVIDCDFRKPEAHLFLGALAGRGLTDAIEDGFDGDFDHVIEHTSISGVRLITSGRPVNQPASVIPRLAGVIAEARQRADVVLIDSSPLLVVSEAVDVLPYADAAVVTCRLRRTTHEQARRSRLVLQRAEVPVLGVVLTGTEPVRGTAYGRPTRLQAFRTVLREWVRASSNQSRRAFSSTRTAPTAAEDPAASQIHPVVPAWHETEEPAASQTHPVAPAWDEPVEERQPERHQEDWRLDWEDHWKDQTEDHEDQQTDDPQADDPQADDHQEASPQPPERRYHRRHEQVGESLEKQHNGEPDNRPVELHYNRWHGSSPMQESPEGESADDTSDAEQEQAFRSAG